MYFDEFEWQVQVGAVSSYPVLLVFPELVL